MEYRLSDNEYWMAKTSVSPIVTSVYMWNRLSNVVNKYAAAHTFRVAESS